MSASVTSVVENGCVGRRRPNLFLIGAMKSGTTYLRKLLNAHPEIFMCEPDEPSYFVDPQQLKIIWVEMWERGFWRDEENYFKLFSSAENETILGEASTNYTKYPLVSGVAERIHLFNPNARFIYIIRDPIERVLSHYWHMVRYHAERRTIVEAIKRDDQYLAVSYYAMQATVFLERFGRDRVAILTYESLVGDPAGAMRRLYEWLGLGVEAVDISGLTQPEHVTPEVVKASSWGGIPRRLRQSSPFRSMLRHIPQPIEQALRRITTQDMHRRIVDVTDAIEFLRPIQLRQTEELTRLLGREFPEWTTLYGEVRRSHREPEPEGLPPIGRRA